VITYQIQWRAATSHVLTVDQAQEATAHTAVYAKAPSPLATAQGTRLPFGATTLAGAGAPTAGFTASGVVQAPAGRMAVIDRNRLTDVPGVSPRGAPV
jgi:hypothetical protein